MRISQRQRIDTAIYRLQQNEETVENLRTQVATRRRVLKPSDDPQAAQQGINLRTYLSGVRTSLRNLSYSQDWMDTTDSGLKEIADILAQAGVQARRAATDTLSDELRQSIAAEVRAMFVHATGVANTEHRGQYIFAGLKVDEQPFSVDLDTMTVTYQGDGGAMRHQIEPGFEMQVNVTGQDPLFDATFSALKTLYDGLVANDMDVVRGVMDDLDAAIDLTLNQEANLGAHVRVVNGARGRLEALEVDLQGLLSNAEDIDLPEAILKLSSSEQGYQATLSALSRVVPQSLFDYLR